jgi:ribonuclease HI
VARRKPTAIIPRERVLSVYTDGSSVARGRHGGIGIRFVYCDRDGNEEAWDQVEDGFQTATNNEMELVAVISALQAVQRKTFRHDLLDQASKIEVFTDSDYVASNVGRAIYGWRKSGWTTRDGNPVANADLWMDLVRNLQKARAIKPVEIKWGKGHSSGNPHNQVVDKLAKQSARRAVRPPVSVSTVRRKMSTKPLERGSVEMLGQRLTVRIIAAKHLRKQKTSQYTYEVVSPGSRYFGNVDVAFSGDPQMRPGHRYVVSMNRDTAAPRIVRCHREVASEEPQPPQ